MLKTDLKILVLFDIPSLSDSAINRHSYPQGNSYTSTKLFVQMELMTNLLLKIVFLQAKILSESHQNQ